MITHLPHGFAQSLKLLQRTLGREQPPLAQQIPNAWDHEARAIARPQRKSLRWVPRDSNNLWIMVFEISYDYSILVQI